MKRMGSTWSGLAGLACFLLVSISVFNCGGSGSGSSTGISGDQNTDVLVGAYQPTTPVACADPGAPPSSHTYYLDPVNGNMANDGSEANPWGTLQELVDSNMIATRAYADLPYNGSNALVEKNGGAPVKAGDTLVLLSGFHGRFYLRGAYNEYPITVRAAAGHRPMLSQIVVSAGANWHFEGLVVSPSAAPTYTAGTLVHIESHGWHGPSNRVVVENCELYSVSDTSGWSESDWNTLACSAISVSGDCVTIRDNICRNVDFGITIGGNSCRVSGNTVENFAGDGLRGLGNDLVFEYNTVKNCYDVNGNHDDGFQSWSINDDPPRERVVLRGNVFINYEDPNQPFRGTLQGIGCFDGPYVDWVVENNLVITNHWHGISLYGALNSRIVNNTVVDRVDDSIGPPWVMVNPHKDGTPSQGCIIRNNIAASIIATGDTVEDHNYRLTGSDQLFENPVIFDYHLRSDATAVIDQGSSDLAPGEDLDRTLRPKGQSVDIGAYEY